MSRGGRQGGAADGESIEGGRRASGHGGSAPYSSLHVRPVRLRTSPPPRVQEPLPSTMGSPRDNSAQRLPAPIWRSLPAQRAAPLPASSLSSRRPVQISRRDGDLQSSAFVPLQRREDQPGDPGLQAQPRGLPPFNLREHVVRIDGAKLRIFVPGHFSWTAAYDRCLGSILEVLEKEKKKSFSWKCNRAVERLQSCVNTREEIHEQFLNLIEERKFEDLPLVEILPVTVL